MQQNWMFQTKSQKQKERPTTQSNCNFQSTICSMIEFLFISNWTICPTRLRFCIISAYIMPSEETTNLIIKSHNFNIFQNKPSPIIKKQYYIHNSDLYTWFSFITISLTVSFNWNFNKVTHSLMREQTYTTTVKSYIPDEMEANLDMMSVYNLLLVKAGWSSRYAMSCS